MVPWTAVLTAMVLPMVPAIVRHLYFVPDRKNGGLDRAEVAVLDEPVSPSNKYAGPGRDKYVSKQQEVLGSDSHLVEIDLLRYGPHVLAVPEAQVAGRFKYHYLVSVNRAAARRNRFEVYPRTVRQPLPWIQVPLAGDDPDAQLEIRAALEQAYEAGSYRDRIRYDAPCQPPLDPEHQTWANELNRSYMTSR